MVAYPKPMADWWYLVSSRCSVFGFQFFHGKETLKSCLDIHRLSTANASKDLSSFVGLDMYGEPKCSEGSEYDGVNALEGERITLVEPCSFKRLRVLVSAPKAKNSTILQEGRRCEHVFGAAIYGITCRTRRLDLGLHKAAEMF